MPLEEYRIQQIERRIAKLEDRTEDVNVLRNQLANVQDDMQVLAKEVGGVRKALYTAALSVTGGTVIFALTLLQFLHR